MVQINTNRLANFIAEFENWVFGSYRTMTRRAAGGILDTAGFDPKKIYVAPRVYGLIDRATVLRYLSDVPSTDQIQFVIVHRFYEKDFFCRPGEEVALVFLLHKGKLYPLGLSLALRLVFDFMARNRLPLSAQQLALGLKADPFTMYHATNVAVLSNQTRSWSRSAITVYVDRIRRALGCAFADAEIAVDPRHVLQSRQTVSKEVGYEVVAPVRLVHIDPIEIG